MGAGRLGHAEQLARELLTVGDSIDSELAVRLAVGVLLVVGVGTVTCDACLCLRPDDDFGEPPGGGEKVCSACREAS